jgi:hypothetical protein
MKATLVEHSCRESEAEANVVRDKGVRNFFGGSERAIGNLI